MSTLITQPFPFSTQISSNPLNPRARRKAGINEQETDVATPLPSAVSLSNFHQEHPALPLRPHIYTFPMNTHLSPTQTLFTKIANGFPRCWCHGTCLILQPTGLLCSICSSTASPLPLASEIPLCPEFPVVVLDISQQVPISVCCILLMLRIPSWAFVFAAFHTLSGLQLPFYKITSKSALLIQTSLLCNRQIASIVNWTSFAGIYMWIFVWIDGNPETAPFYWNPLNL